MDSFYSKNLFCPYCGGNLTEDIFEKRFKLIMFSNMKCTFCGKKVYRGGLSGNYLYTSREAKIRILLFLAVLIAAPFLYFLEQKFEPLPPPIVSNVRSTVELKTQVDNLLASGDNVMIRQGVSYVFELVDRLIESKEEDEALLYLAPALKHNSWAFDYQLLYAQLLKDKDDRDFPRQTLELILKHSEQDKQINAARLLLNQEPVSTVKEMEPITPETVTIVLVPIGNPDINVLNELKLRIMEEIGVSVLLRDPGVTLPEYGRSPLDKAINDLRERLRLSFKQKSIKEFIARIILKKDGVTSESLESDSKVIEAYRRMVHFFRGVDVLNQFDENMVRLRQAEKQWNINDIKNKLREAAKPFFNNNVYFLGITDKDVFEGKYKYLFYSSDCPGQFSVMSYRRFSADFNRDTPNRTHLVNRTLKTSLACIGFMLGVKRCSTPTCPRTYPNSLQELDATSIQMCDFCFKGFNGIMKNP